MPGRPKVVGGWGKLPKSTLLNQFWWSKHTFEHATAPDWLKKGSKIYFLRAFHRQPSMNPQKLRIFVHFCPEVVTGSPKVSRGWGKLSKFTLLSRFCGSNRNFEHGKGPDWLKKGLKIEFLYREPKANHF